MTPADRRAAVVREALAVVGLGAHDPEAYLDLVGPGEAPATRAAMLTMSGCALVAAGVLRRAGLRVEDAPELAPPYRIGSAVSRLLAVARRCEAWRPMGPGAGLPCRGDIVVLMDPEHVLVVVQEPVMLAPDAASIVSIDGGQLDAQGRQVVARRERQWARAAWAAWWRTYGRDERGAWVTERRAVLGWIDAEALPIMTAAERAEVEVYGT